MKLLMAYDGSACGDAAIEDLKRAGLPREGEALVVSVADDSWPSTKGAASSVFETHFATALHEAGRLAGSGRDRIQASFPGWKVSAESLWGSPAKAILKTAEWFAPDLLAVGSHGRGAVGRMVVGSVSLNLLHHATCPVRVSREKPAATGPIRIVIATDGSPSADAAVQQVARRSWPAGTKARLVAIVQTYVPPPTMYPGLEAGTFSTEPAAQIILAADERERARLRGVVEASAAVLERSGLAVDPIVLEGDARTLLLAEAKSGKADTMFLGARGLGVLDRLLLGSVSSAVVAHAECSVEVVRHA